MPAQQTCPKCGTILSPDALEGLCPKCVGRAAFDHPSQVLPLSTELEEHFARLKPEEADDHMGPYKLLQQIGEGGFGIVWMAEQEQPVRRRVALKIIKLCMKPSTPSPPRTNRPRTSWWIIRTSPKFSTGVRRSLGDRFLSWNLSAA